MPEIRICTVDRVDEGIATLVDDKRAEAFNVPVDGRDGILYEGAHVAVEQDLDGSVHIRTAFEGEYDAQAAEKNSERLSRLFNRKNKK